MKKNVLVIICSIFFGCSLNVSDPANPNNGIEQPANIVRKDDYFKYDAEKDLYVFETNNKSFINSKGYTIWAELFTNPNEEFKPISYKISKISGNPNSCYGVVFCSQTVQNCPYLITFMINNNSEYQVGKVENGVYKTIKTLSYSEYISSTAGEYNEIKILCDERKIKCYVLGYEIYSFDLEENVIIKNSKSGFVVNISKYDKFPEKPVKVVFKKD